VCKVKWYSENNRTASLGHYSGIDFFFVINFESEADGTYHCICVFFFIHYNSGYLFSVSWPLVALMDCSIFPSLVPTTLPRWRHIKLSTKKLKLFQVLHSMTQSYTDWSNDPEICLLHSIAIWPDLTLRHK